ncbi:AaceriAGR236Wp [[Ashbya] aceris (nom. inval.)]|nr:AaceriAGR236Wp [[Ashbya] aceris (nom. inval.)]
MKVEELIIDGFKSYATRTVISGWDPQFNAITGLNGSGKSNILDSICFVLGISSMATVRAQNLQDLIYKRGQAGVIKASVTIVFDNSDQSSSPIGFETYPKISVTRQIILGGTSKYLINGHRAQQQTVLHLFQSVQLNINNPNFLIMQGKITKVLNMKPDEILALIEEAAGTRMFEDRREKAEKTMAKKETKLQEIRALLLEEIEPKLNRLRNEKRAFLEFQQTQTDLEKTLRIVNTHDYQTLVQKRSSMQERLQSDQQRIKDLEFSVEKYRDEISTLTEDFESIRRQKEKQLQKDTTLQTLEAKENSLSTELSRATAALGITRDDLAEEQRKLSALKVSIAKSEKELISLSKSYSETEGEYVVLNSEIEKLKTLCRNKEELLSTLTTGISSTGTTEGGYTAQLNTAKVQLNEAQIAVKKVEMRITMLRKELATNEPLLERAKKDNEAKRVELLDNKSHVERLQESLTASGFKPELLKQLKQKEAEIKTELYAISTDAEYLKRKVANLEFSYSPPSKDFNPKSVKGIAAQVFTLSEENFDSANALQICAGGRLFNVIVDNEKTASQLLERGRLRKRVTIIPLNKISSRVINNETLNKAKSLAPGAVELALNLIGYETEVARAMEFIFGGSLICKNAATAKKVTFHPQVRARSITLDGDIYDPEGTLSGGSRNHTSSLLIDIQKYNEAAKHIRVLEKELYQVQADISQHENASRMTKSLQNELNLAKHKCQLAENALDSNPAAQIIKRNAEIHKEIEASENDRDAQSARVNALQLDILRIQRDMDEFNTDKGSKLEQLRAEIKDLKCSLSENEEVIEKKYDLYQNLQMETEQLQNDIVTMKQELVEKEQLLQSLEERITALEKEVTLRSNDLESVQLDLNEERNKLLRIDEEIEELTSLIKDKSKKMTESELEYQKLTAEVNKFKYNTEKIEEEIQVLQDENNWLSDAGLVANILNQNEGINLDEYRERAKQLQEKFQGMKRKVNPNIMSMIENVEKKEAALKTMIKTIEKDKMKIVETIGKLNEYKRDALVKTWEKVNVDFGNIFAELLPNSFAKLAAIEGKDVTAGLEVKVKLGTLWKESLVELSGGQRSLIALSLILALLQFKPAPMYILDEVDAALDLSHTQNIGHLIKTRFKGSQFIVVSLKEGMFTNANRVFKTRFQDGTSVVSVL